MFAKTGVEQATQPFHNKLKNVFSQCSELSICFAAVDDMRLYIEFRSGYLSVTYLSLSICHAAVVTHRGSLPSEQIPDSSRDNRFFYSGTTPVNSATSVQFQTQSEDFTETEKRQFQVDPSQLHVDDYSSLMPWGIPRWSAQ